MTTALLIFIVLTSLALGYCVGLVQGGIHIYTDKKPLVPSAKNEEPQYNEDYTHLLPPDMQEYFKKNSGFIK